MPKGEFSFIVKLSGTSLASHAGSEIFLMSAEKDKQYLVCVRIVEGRNPPVVSTRDECGRCKAPVWKASTSNSILEIAEILCINCMLKAIAAGDSNVKIMPPTRKQIESIASVLKRANN
jgi:hypothetical protein